MTPKIFIITKIILGRVVEETETPCEAFQYATQFFQIIKGQEVARIVHLLTLLV